MALDEIVWLITLLCNQPILVHNLKHPEDKKPELTAEEVELLTSPMELADYKDASWRPCTGGRNGISKVSRREKTRRPG